MKTPIIIDEHGDITLYPTVKEAENALEATDVRNGEYIAYDSEGGALELIITVDHRRISPIELVQIRSRPDAPRDEAGLRKKLMQFLVAIGNDPSRLGGLSLNDLLARVGAAQRKG